METLRTLIEGLQHEREHHAVLTFTRTGALRWTRAQLRQAGINLARCLIARGIGPGDAVALFADVSPSWIAAVLGAMRIGVVVIPLDVQFSRDILAQVLADSGARFVLTDTAHAKTLPAGTPMMPIDEDVVIPDVSLPEPSVDAYAVAAMLYTSGTTGPPKGVPLTHSNLIYQIDVLASSHLVHDGDCVLLPLPAHHVYPFALGVLVPLALGLPIVIPAGLTGPQIARALRESRATVVIGVPRLYSALFGTLEARMRAAGHIVSAAFHAALVTCGVVRRMTGINLGRVVFAPLHRRLAPRLRLAACGGAPLDTTMARHLEAFGWDLAIGYGLTETSPLLSLDHSPVRYGSVGKAVLGSELRIHDGEIQARGPGVFAGYHQQPDKTRAAFSADGWLRTGDCGAMDADGYLYVHGRLAEIIVTAGGVNVQPEEVEALFVKNPVIREAALLPGEQGLTLLVVPDEAEILRFGMPVEEAMRNAITEETRRLASYQRPVDFAITYEPLPRTRLGKLQRHRLPERYQRARIAGARAQTGPLPPEQWTSSDQSLLVTEAARQAWAWLASHYADRRLTPDTHVALELGIDSLGWIDLTLELATRAGVELDDAAIAKVEKVRDLLVAAAEAQQAEERGGWLAHPERVLGAQERAYLTPLTAPVERIARILTHLTRWLMGHWFRVQVRGVEHLPARGPFLLVPNHTSLLDPFALAAVIPEELVREVHWAGIAQITFANAVMRGFSRMAHVLPVDPRRGVVSSIALATAVLDAGKPLVWFPEGQRSPDGRLLPFKRGIGLLLTHRRVPVIPVLIRGAHDALPLGRFLPRFSPIVVQLGEPLMPEELARLGHGMRDDERITDGLHARLWQMCTGDTPGVDVGQSV